MNRRRQAEHSTGIYLAFPGVDAAVFTVQGGQQRAADLGDHQHAVRSDRTHHQTQGIHMGAEPHLVSALPTGTVMTRLPLLVRWASNPSSRAIFSATVTTRSVKPVGCPVPAASACVHQKGLTGPLPASFPLSYLSPIFVIKYPVPSYKKSRLLARGGSK